MKNMCNHSQFRSFTITRQIVGGITLLLAMSMAGPARLWAQCDPSWMLVPSLTVSASSLIGASTQTATGTVTVANIGNTGAFVPIYAGGLTISSKNFYFGELTIPAGSNSGTFTIIPGFDVTQPTTVNILASIGQCGSSVPLTITPNAPTLSLSPSSVDGGGSQTVTATVTMTAVVPTDFYLNITNPGLTLSGQNLSFSDLIIRGGTNASTFTISPYAVTQPSRVYIGISVSGVGLTTLQPLDILPAGYGANAADNGRAACIVGCSSPINITNGNVWIDQRDYSVPGLGGGLELSRVWNSQWIYANPPTLAGMFGLGWRSTYEEELMPLGSQSLIYWRGDGSGWTFTFNSVLNSYSLASPPNERAQLVMNPATGGFILTLPDGTQKVFNGQGLLAAVIDRNNNQSTIAYDSSNRITSVTSPGGSTLTFTYGDPNNVMQVTTAQDSVGTVATYVYDSSSRLTSVTYPDGSALNFTYDSNSNVLSVTDSQGKLLESHTYDAQGRGLTSSRAYGADSVTLAY